MQFTFKREAIAMAASMLAPTLMGLLAVLAAPFLLRHP